MRRRDIGWRRMRTISRLYLTVAYMKTKNNQKDPHIRTYLLIEYSKDIFNIKNKIIIVELKYILR